MEAVPEEDFTLPIGEASIVREGSDITLVAWGQQVPVLEQAVSWECEGPMLSCFWQQQLQDGPWPACGNAKAGDELGFQAQS